MPPGAEAAGGMAGFAAVVSPSPARWGVGPWRCHLLARSGDGDKIICLRCSHASRSERVVAARPCCPGCSRLGPSSRARTRSHGRGAGGEPRVAPLLRGRCCARRPSPGRGQRRASGGFWAPSSGVVVGRSWVRWWGNWVRGWEVPRGQLLEVAAEVCEGPLVSNSARCCISMRYAQLGRKLLSWRTAEVAAKS